LWLTFLILGAPNRWAPPPERKPLLTPDAEGNVRYADENAARHPRSPLEPLFRALFYKHPDFPIQDVDIVTDWQNMLNLLLIVTVGSNHRFKAQVEIVGGKTALFTRLEDKPADVNQGFTGYRQNFLKAYTAKEP